MENFLAIIRDLVGIVCLTGLFCCLPGVAFGYFAYYLGYELPRTLSAPRRLAEQMNLQELAPGREYGHRWYGGTHQGRVLALAVERGRKEWASDRGPAPAHLRVIMEVRLSQPLGVLVVRKSRGQPDTFESAFDADQVVRLSPEARAALFNFVRKPDPSPRLSVINFSSGRNLRLRDRRDPPKGEPLPQATVLLVHDVVNVLKATPDSLRLVLDELAEIAQVIETTC